MSSNTLNVENPTGVQFNEAVTSRPAEMPVRPFQFLDLKAQFETIREETMAAITQVMESQHFILGKQVEWFEQECAQYIGAKHAIACASGSDALVLSLLALGIGPGDEVITSPFTFFATAGSIARVGARPVFVDIDPLTFNLKPELLENAVTTRTKAVMPVHLFGLCADMDPILEISGKNGIAVVEDAAQAIGAKYKGRPAGTMGDFGCFSFFPSKNLGGAGDGGLITTENAEFARKLKLLRVHGSQKKYHHELLGINSRLDALQAAILRVKLKHLPDWTAGRQNRAERYRVLLSQLGIAESVDSPKVPPSDYFHVFNQFTVRCKNRDALRVHLSGLGIPTEVYYPLCLHLQPAFSYLGYESGQFPQAEKASREALSLPVYPELSDGQQNIVIEAFKEFYQELAQQIQQSAAEKNTQ